MITRKTLELYAPKLYGASIKHLMSLRSIQEHSGAHTHVLSHIEHFMRFLGLSTADMIMHLYNDSMLNNDEFRTTVILYVCTCVITNSDELTIGDFRSYLVSVQDIAGGNISTNDTLKFFSEIFKIDPKVVPEYVKDSMSNTFEEREANAICEKAMGKIDDPANYSDFDRYHDYIEEETKGIIHSLNSEGYTNTHSLDVMVKLVILRKIGFQALPLYSATQYLPFPKGLLNALAQKMFSISQNGGMPSGGGLLDLGGFE